jgi:dihydroflavonol-4-reductase
MILVTGASGHVGNVLVRELVNRGEKTRAIVLPGEDVSMIELDGVEILRGDIRDRDFVIKACEGIETVYHLAALISIMPTMKKQVRSVNIGGTENVIHACKVQNVGKLIYTSSVHAFTELEPGSVIDENVSFNPARTSGVYGKSKAEAVLNVLTAAREGLNAVILCPTGIIGPFDYKLSEMGNMIRLFATGKLRIGIEGSFDFVDVRDVVRSEIEASIKAKAGEVYILGGEVISIRELTDILHQITGKKRVNTFLRSSSAYALSAMSTLYYMISKTKAAFTPYTVHTLTRNYRYSHEKASRILGHSPRKVSESLKDAVEWLSRYGTIKLQSKLNSSRQM